MKVGIIVGTTVGTLLVPTLSALIIASLIVGFDLPQRLGTIGFITSLPFLYFLWLNLVLLLAAGVTTALTRKFPKPRRASLNQKNKESRGLVVAAACYMRATQIISLPFAMPLLRLPVFRDLALRAYAGSSHVHPTAMVWGVLYDPDLIEIEENALIGGNAMLVAHGMNRLTDGDLIYVSAPIRIGPRATVGGECRVALGVTVGADAIVEPYSNILPFTQIRAGEIWGGNPAKFLRRREDIPLDPNQEEPAAATVPAAEADTLAQEIIASALNLPRGTLASTSCSNDFAAWDSLGQIAIAAATHARVGLALDTAAVFGLKSVADLAQHLAHPAAKSTIVPAADLPANPELIPLLDREVATRALAQATFTTPAKSCRVVVAASFTADPLAAPLKLWARPFGIAAEVQFHDYNQIPQALLDPGSSFRTNAGGLNVVLIRPEDLPGTGLAGRTANIDRLLSNIRSFMDAKTGAALAVSTLPPAVSSYFDLDRTELDDLRAQWRRGLASIPGVEILDFAAVIERIGRQAAVDADLEATARIPYSWKVFQELSADVARLLRRLHRPPAKVLALDCDGTIWGGVLGEDGSEGLVLGADGRGRGFLLFQQAVKRLKERGVLLVLVSRNEETDVCQVLDEHPEMHLKREDIAASRINWNRKSQSLRELAAQLNVGLDSFVFMDDDAAVRLEVEQNVPQVTVVPLPSDPAHYCETLAALWVFDGAQPTAEDAERTRMIQEEAARQELQEATGSLDGYLQSLGLTVTFEQASEADLPRVAQLTQKTNQFNLSLQRRTLEEIRALDGTAKIFTCRAADRFGDYGLVGVAILNAPAGDALEIDTLLLSCRALGRGVEQAFLYGIVQEALRSGATLVQAPFVEGPRNQPARKFFTESGFHLKDNSVFEAVAGPAFPLPGHVTWKGPAGATLPLGHRPPAAAISS